MAKVYDVEGVGKLELDDEDLTPDEVHRLLSLYTEGKVGEGKKDPQVSRNLQSLKMGIMDPLMGATQFVANVNPLRSIQDKLYQGVAEKTGLPLTTSSLNRAIAEREKQYQSSLGLGQEEGVDWYRGLGNVLSPVNIGIGGVPGRAESFLGRIGENAARGVGYGSVMPTSEEGFNEEKLAQMGLAGGVGAAISPLSSGISRLIAPTVPEDIQFLRSLGVTPTLGQRLGPRANRLEQGMTSAPLLGSGIKEARNRSITQFNMGLANRTMKKVGESIPRDLAPGYDTIEYMGRKLGDKYDELLPNLKGALDKPFQSQLANLQTMAKSLPRDVQTQFDDILQNQVIGKFTSHGLASGETLKEIESELGRLASGYLRDPSYDKVQLGSAVREVQRSLRDMIERNNPSYAGQLQPINSAWKDFLRLEGASSMKGASRSEGVFTPSQLVSTARRMDPTRKKSQFARGRAPLQNEGMIAERALGTHIPDSGSPFRLAVNMGLLGGGYALNPGVLGLELATMAPYTAVGQRAADLALSGGMKWRQPAGEGIRRLGALSTPALVDQLKNK